MFFPTRLRVLQHTLMLRDQDKKCENKNPNSHFIFSLRKKKTISMRIKETRAPRVLILLSLACTRKGKHNA